MSSSVSLLPVGEPHLLDRYQLIGEIATGGMATVFLARIAGVAGFQRFVAIKQLHPHLARRPEFVEMFLDEARLAASIHHQNVVPIIEIGTSDGGYYIVMEYVEGVTLTRLLREGGGKFPRRIALRIMIDVLSGLDAAHELTDNAGMLLGVVHRDCSPQNILVGLDGCSRLTDFGIARASQRLATTRDGSMKGKIAYMAPEQTQGEDVDRRADLFSIGVVVWECLAQRRLFKRKADAAALRALLNDDIPLLSDIVPNIAPELVVCVARSLDRVPERRFQTAVAMADALEEAAGEEKGEGIATVREVEAHMRRQFGDLFGIQREEVRSYLVGTPSIRGFGGPVSQSGVRTSGAPLPRVSEPTRRGEAPNEEERTRVYGRQSGPEIAVPRRVRAAVKSSDVALHVASSSLSSLPSAVASVSAVRSVPTDSISSQPPKVDGDTGIYPASTGGKSRAFMLLLGLSVLVLAGLVVHDFGVTPAPESAPSLVPVVVPPESPGIGAEADPTATPAKISPQAAASAERSRSETPPIGTAEKKKPQKTKRPRAQVPTRRQDAVGSSRPVPATSPAEIPRPSAPDNQGGAPKPPKAVLAPPNAPKLKPAAPALDDDLANPYR